MLLCSLCSCFSGGGDSSDSLTHQVQVTNGNGGGCFAPNVLAMISAEVPDGQYFSHWQKADGQLFSDDNPFTFNVNSDLELTAVFVPTYEKDNLIYILDETGSNYIVVGYNEATTKRYIDGTLQEIDLITQIEIPNSVNGKDVVAIGDNCFRNFLYLREVILPSRLKTIGVNAFNGCLNLVSLVIPSTVTSIGANAFARCHKLVEVYNLSQVSMEVGTVDGIGIGSNALVIHRDVAATSRIKVMDDCLFYVDETSSTYYLLGNATSLVEDIPSVITLPEHILGHDYDIYQYAFAYHLMLQTIIIPSGVKTIGENAFLEAFALREVVFAADSSLEAIGEKAFYHCFELLSFTLPSNATTIGTDAFKHCYHLVEVTNLSNLEITIGSNIGGEIAKSALCLNETESASKIVTSSGLSFYIDETSSMYLLVDYQGKDSDLVLPNDVFGHRYGIVDYAFINQQSLKSITIPASITSIGYGILAWCNSLQKVTLPLDNYQAKFSDVFGTYLGNENAAYLIPTTLTHVVITEGTTLIADAFADCENLASISLPVEMTAIDPDAFADCIRLVEVGYAGGSNGFEESHSLIAHNLIFHTEAFVSKVATDADGFISYVDSANELYYLIGYTGSLSSLTLPHQIANHDYQILANAFSKYFFLNDVVIPAGVTAIGDQAFYGCLWLHAVDIADSVKRIGKASFEGDLLLHQIVIPDSVIEMGEYAFDSALGLAVYAEASEQPHSWHANWLKKSTADDLSKVVWAYK